MKIWRITIRYAELAVKLKPLAIQGEARLHGREQTIYSKDLRQSSRGEDVLPDPGALRVGVLTRQRVGQGEQGAQNPVLGRGGNVFIDGRVGEEGFDFGCAHLFGAPFAVEEG